MRKKNQDTMFCCTDKERDDNDNNNHVVLTRIENPYPYWSDLSHFNLVRLRTLRDINMFFFMLSRFLASTI